MQTYICEITDGSNQARAFSLMSVCFGLGCIIGPIVGGFLSNVSQKYPSLFPHDGVFGQHPYFFPCLLASVLSAVGAIAGYLYLEESLPNAQPVSVRALLCCRPQNGAKMPSSSSASGSTGECLSALEGAEKVCVCTKDEKDTAPLLVCAEEQNERSARGTAAREAQGNGNAVSSYQSTMSSASVVRRLSSRTICGLSADSLGGHGCSASASVCPKCFGPQVPAMEEQEEPEITMWEMLGDRAVVMVAVVSCLLAATQCMSDEVFMVWAIRSVEQVLALFNSAV